MLTYTYVLIIYLICNNLLNTYEWTISTFILFNSNSLSTLILFTFLFLKKRCIDDYFSGPNE